MRPIIFAACDKGYYDKYGKVLERSAAKYGMECFIHCSGIYVRNEQLKANHNVLRYLMLPDLLEKHPSILVLDVDSIINDRIEIPDRYDLGLFFRDTPDKRKKILASAVYITDRAKDFANDLRDKLLHQTVWYEDQAAIWKVYQKYFDKYDVMQMGLSFINWHCKPAPIWTGKGDVKLKNPDYMKRQAIFA